MLNSFNTKFDNNGNVKRRIKDLLDELSIGEHLQSINIDNLSTIEELLYTPINYDAVERERQELARKSHDWLVQAIENQ